MNAREADEVLVSDDARGAGRVDITVVHGRYETALNVSAGELVRLRAAIDERLFTLPADDVRAAVEAERQRAAAHAREGYRGNENCDDIAKRILSGEPAADEIPGRVWGPPAVDVREALVSLLEEWGEGAVLARDIMERFEVRPHGTVADADEELARLSDAARPGPWKAHETVQADNFIVEEKQGLLLGPGPVMGPSYDRSTTQYVVELVNRHRAALEAAREVRS
ncbi:hypothetical protein [Microbacterium testaceum]|uniref:hypothetical protein n=1 Tax=Microbacterium testaceum TaxID=2033 RepID=UPI002435A6D0|nr:hypothetical protein [Microbacterium testaceum]